MSIVTHCFVTLHVIKLVLKILVLVEVVCLIGNVMDV